MNTTSLQFGLITQESSVRASNGDVVYAQLLRGGGPSAYPEMGLFMVCDGLGADPEAGDASRAIVQTVAEEYSQHILLPCLETVKVPAEAQVTQLMIHAFQKADQRVLTEIPHARGSLTTAVIVGDRVYLLHVGDTRAYLVQEDEIKQLTKDHDLVQVLVDAGQFASREELWEGAVGLRNQLFNAFGQTDSLRRIDTSVHSLDDGTGILLCSGGLRVDYQEDVDKSLRIIRESQDAQDACQRLIDWGKKQGPYKTYIDTSVIFISRNFPFESA